MSSSATKRDSERFDRFLSIYQKICVFMVFPPLLSAFSTLVAQFNADMNILFGLAMSLGFYYVLGLSALNAFFIGLGVVAVYVPVVLLSAKGKIVPYLVGASIYFIDFIYLFFLIANIPTIVFVLTLIVHIAFLAAFTVGAVFYFKADKILKANPKILDVKK